MKYVTHTWFLSQILQMRYVEKFQFYIHDKCGEIWNFSTSVMWRYFRFLHMIDVKKSKIYPHLSCEDISDFFTWQMWEILQKTDFLQFTLFCCESVLLWFTRFCMEKIEPKIVYVENKWQISGIMLHCWPKVGSILFR